MCICVISSCLVLHHIFEDDGPSPKSTVKYGEKLEQMRKGKAQPVKVLIIDFCLCIILVILHKFGGSYVT